MDKESFVALAGLGLLIAGVAYVATDESRTELKKTKIEKGYPPEYWVAKAEEARAKISIRKAEIESQERLATDRREREDVARRELLEFEKNAPDGYWEHKKTETRERTKLKEEEARLEADKARLEADKYIARRNAEAVRDGARTVGYALRHTWN